MDRNTESTERHRELTLMFLKMGQSLVNEGLKNKDYITASLGNTMIFMSSLTSDIDEVRLFGEMCNMMSSRRLVKGITDGSLDLSRLGNLKDMSKSDTFQEIIKRIKKDLDNDVDNDNS